LQLPRGGAAGGAGSRGGGQPGQCATSLGHRPLAKTDPSTPRHPWFAEACSRAAAHARRRNRAIGRLIARRRQIVEMMTAEKTGRHQVTNPDLKATSPLSRRLRKALNEIDEDSTVPCVPARLAGQETAEEIPAS